LLFADDLIQRDLPYFRLFYRHISREECIQWQLIAAEIREIFYLHSIGFISVILQSDQWRDRRQTGDTEWFRFVLIQDVDDLSVGIFYRDADIEDARDSFDIRQYLLYIVIDFLIVIADDTEADRFASSSSRL
jgi:hypothetical protein